MCFHLFDWGNLNRKLQTKQLFIYNYVYEDIGLILAQEAALVGINVDHSILIAYAKEQKPVPKGEVEHKQAFHSPYFGGDVRLSGVNFIDKM